MKALGVLLYIALFAYSAYAGYRLTERSFAWVDQPNFGQPAPISGAAPASGVNSLKISLPAPGQSLADWIKSLAPVTQDCLQKAIGAATLAAVARGEKYAPTPAVTAQILLCLQR